MGRITNVDTRPKVSTDRKQGRPTHIMGHLIKAADSDSAYKLAYFGLEATQHDITENVSGPRVASRHGSLPVRGVDALDPQPRILCHRNKCLFCRTSKLLCKISNDK